MSTTLQFTDEQQSAIDTLVKLKHDVQTLGGYAGSGKTTVIKALTEQIDGLAVCAYTGKAAQVLRRKGVLASTIHSLIYKVVGAEEGGPISFVLKDRDELPVEAIAIDEGSMVPKPIYDDLKSFGVPLIFIGDHGQLEPVGSGDFNLMREPQVTLTQIHRNAGEIARFAEHLRNGEEPLTWLGYDKSTQVQIVEADRLGQVEGIDEDCQMIAAYNRTRVSLNQMVREHLGRPERPSPGDRVVCLQNDRKLQVFNGMQGHIVGITQRMLTFDTGDRQFTVPYNPEAFGSERTPEWQRGIIPFDWAYCVTCHKAQGDEWDHVVVVEQRCGAWDHRRWAYTAASRAKTKLTWVLE